MSLFQNSVLRNYLQNLDTTLALQAYERYRSDFLPKIANIRTSKEEQYQYGFLDDLFVKILGYTLNPSPDYNLIAEQKNLSDSKKADGAVLRDGNVIAVIELKSTKTRSMDKIVDQAFGYKHNHPTCKYVITSNFEKLRLYVEHSDKYEEFDLFELDESRFILLYSLLSKDNIFVDTPLTLKQQSKLQEENISNELYKKYATLRTNLFENIIQNNPEIDKNILLEKTQTILDRMVFIFFAEDRGILKPNTIQAIITHYRNDIEDRDLWHFYKIYFNAINRGNTKLGIPEYNGGLFADDGVLDSIIIDDSVIELLPLALSAYDFNTDIDVNILGHIFENSLNDIEELKARIADENFDASKSKRKKDGVFYTPEYITKYIVDNTLGSLCQAHKEKLGLGNIEIEIPKNPKKLTKSQTAQREALEAYREYLLSLKILDPACGSGAFLNQALNYLLDEHSFIDEGIRTLMGGDVLGLYDVKKGILENNLYGVDINAEAVEIAKLSLWLRTVESGRKLNRLADKIKVGNSLIDDKSVVDNAFVWEEEFAEVFEQGGFDVVIGNPPYIDSESMTKTYANERKWITKHYKVAKGNWDIFVPFVELGLKITKEKKYLSYIIPNKILSAKYGIKLRNFINNSYSIEEIFDLSKNSVFTVDVYPVILFIKKQKQSETIKITLQKTNIQSRKIEYKPEDNWSLYLDKHYSLYSKIINKFHKIDDVKDYSVYSSASVAEAYEIKEYIEDKKDIENSFKLINTGTIDPYISLWGIQEMQYIKDKYTYPRVSIKNVKNKDWTDKPKIALAGMVTKIEAFIDIDGSFLPLKSTTVITSENIINLKSITTLLNSKLITFLFRIANSANTMAGGYLNVNPDNIKMLPISKIDEKEKNLFASYLDNMINLTKTFQTKKQKFLKRVKDNFDLEKLSKKLAKFYESDFKTFFKELKKKKVTLTLLQQDEWEEYFGILPKRATRATKPNR